MRNMPRVLFLLFFLCLSSMIFVLRCVINFDTPSLDKDTEHRHSFRKVKPSTEGIEMILKDKEEKCELKLMNVKKELQAEINKYKLEVKRLLQLNSNLESQLGDARKMTQEIIHNGSPEAAKYKEMAVYLQNHFDQKFKEAEVINGVSFNNEYELFPFCRFTTTRIYLVDPGLGKRVVEKPIGYKKKEILEVINYGVEKLNEKRGNKPGYTAEDFLEGIYRTEATMGTHYELYFRDVDQRSSLHYRKLTYTRPFGPLHLLENESVITQSQLINLILPLKGRIDKFQTFMERFAKVCIQYDKRVHLTVVYFGNEGLEDVKSIIGKITKEYNFKHIMLVTLSEPFSRGRGLQIGAQSWSKADVLLFFCDVDVVFSTDFLERCRLNTKKGRRVYYPIVFSLYNPSVVYSLQDVPIPHESEQLVISKDTGFWRDFGYGMTCQYKSDFQKSRGFDEQINGWGLEDVYLYKKYVKSTYFVVRATDPGIFHLWHEKFCDPNTPPDQYRGCIRSKALNEASHSQLGMLAYKEEVELHKNLLKKKKKSKQR